MAYWMDGWMDGLLLPGDSELLLFIVSILSYYLCKLPSVNENELGRHINLHK